MRSIKELLIILREEMDKRKAIHGGYSMCILSIKLENLGIITTLEFLTIQNYLNKNTPTTYQIILHRLFDWNWFGPVNCYWWEKNNKTMRLKWLDKQIEKLK